MSYSNALLACENIQGWLDEMWLDPQQWPGQDDRMPFAEWLNDPSNKAILVDRITPGGGKIRTVTVKYQHRYAEDDVEENQPNPNCEGGGKRGEYFTDYTIDPDVNIQVRTSIGLTDFELVCEANVERLNREIAALVDVLDRKVATQQSQQSVLFAGNWSASIPDGTAAGQVNPANRFVISTRLASSTNPDPRAMMLLRNAMDDTGYPDSVFMSGGKLMREYMQYLAAGCCTTNGVDIGEIMRQHGHAYAYDKRLEAAIGSTVSGAGDRFLVFAPRSLQVLSYSRAEGKAAFGELWQRGSNYAYFTIASPRLGVPYDMTLQDDCGELKIALTYTGKVIGLPTDMYSTADDLSGVTWVGGVQITNT